MHCEETAIHQHGRLSPTFVARSPRLRTDRRPTISLASYCFIRDRRLVCPTRARGRRELSVRRSSWTPAIWLRWHAWSMWRRSLATRAAFVERAFATSRETLPDLHRITSDGFWRRERATSPDSRRFARGSARSIRGHSSTFS